MGTNGDNWESDDDQDEGQQQQKPKSGLRTHLDQVTKERDEMKSKLEALELAERKRSVEAAIKAKGYDPQVAELVPDSIASDTAQLEKWLTDKGGLFKTPTKQDETPVPQGFEDDEDGLDDEAEQYSRIGRVNANALPPSKAQDTMARIKQAKTRAELDEVLREFGNTNVG